MATRKSTTAHPVFRKAESPAKKTYILTLVDMNGDEYVFGPFRTREAANAVDKRLDEVFEHINYTQVSALLTARDVAATIRHVKATH